METKRPVEEIADLRIVDNWLEPNDFAQIKDLFYHQDTTWNLVPGISSNDSTNALKNPLNNYMFAHAIYSNYLPKSNAFEKIGHLLHDKLMEDEGMDFTTIWRIKANLYPRTEELQEHPWHTAYNRGRLRGALLMMNTCDGYTGFADGTQVDSVENRCVFFDSTKKHHSTNCTNDQFRMTININYV